MNLENLVRIAKSKYCRDTRYKHVAFLMKRNQILSIGVNKNKTHSKCNNRYYLKYGWNILHAEVDAIIQYNKKDFHKLKLIVLRVRSNGKLGFSKPCPGCQFLIDQLGIKQVYYSLDDQSIVYLSKQSKER